MGNYDNLLAHCILSYTKLLRELKHSFINGFGLLNCVGICLSLSFFRTHCVLVVICEEGLPINFSNLRSQC